MKVSKKPSYTRILLKDKILKWGHLADSLQEIPLPHPKLIEPMEKYITNSTGASILMLRSTFVSFYASLDKNKNHTYIDT